MDWPLTLPQRPIQDGYTETPPENTIRSKMDIGPEKVRKRQTAGVRKIQCTYEMTQEQIKTLDSFFCLDTGYGAMPFNMPHPRKELTAIIARFKEPPTYGAKEHEGLVTISIETIG